MRNKAFTLIELMVTITILALVAAIVMPRFSNITSDAKVANVQGNLVSIRTSIAMYYTKTGDYPKYGDTALKSMGADISKDGTLSETFSSYYSKNKFNPTPGISNMGVSIKETSQVVEERDNQGGWYYYEETGSIYANLPNGVYTLDNINEVWGEEKDNPIIPDEKPDQVIKDPLEDKEYKEGLFDLFWHVDFIGSNGYYSFDKGGIVEEGSWGGAKQPINLDLGNKPAKTVVIKTGNELEDLDAGSGNEWILIDNSKYEYYVENKSTDSYKPRVNLNKGDAIRGLKYSK